MRFWIQTGIIGAAVVLATVTAAAAAGGYALSEGEQKLSCKQLTGRMQVRILQIRDHNERPQPSVASRAIQSGAAALFGGSTKGVDPASDYSNDRAMLEAYNKQLAAKGCATYDLDGELKPKSFRETPAPVIKAAPAKAK
jgi:hypothetical protein